MVDPSTQHLYNEPFLSYDQVGSFDGKTRFCDLGGKHIFEGKRVFAILAGK